jgi:cytidine deaminase
MTIGPSLSAEVAHRASAHARNVADNLGSVLLAQDVAELVEIFDLVGPRDVMLLALDVAKRLARPSISNFHVGSIGLESETGNLILGGNVEFPGAHLGFTLHGEGFVFTRSFSRGTTIAAIAIGEAHPCAHCRQYLSEYAASRNLDLIDPLGHVLKMTDLYPWPFDPGYLGEAGLISGAVPFPQLRFAGAPQDSRPLQKLLASGKRAHTPYSKCPSAVVLRTKDGALIAGSAIESVAFNPSIGPLQAAIVDLLAHGYTYGDIAECWLGARKDGQVDYRRSASELLDQIAPACAFTLLDWCL